VFILNLLNHFGVTIKESRKFTETFPVFGALPDKSEAIEMPINANYRTVYYKDLSKSDFEEKNIERYTNFLEQFFFYSLFISPIEAKEELAFDRLGDIIFSNDMFSMDSSYSFFKDLHNNIEKLKFEKLNKIKKYLQNRLPFMMRRIDWQRKSNSDFTTDDKKYCLSGRITFWFDEKP
jgi:predicted ribosome quality control (RQC) complex YloA/Tae2 family protein